jgi:hypothetical protein
MDKNIRRIVIAHQKAIAFQSIEPLDRNRFERARFIKTAVAILRDGGRQPQAVERFGGIGQIDRKNLDGLQSTISQSRHAFQTRAFGKACAARAGATPKNE